MVSAFGEDAVKDYCRLNAFKYVWRVKQKDSVEPNTRKAMVQFQRMEILHYLNITISHTAMSLRSHSLCGNKNDTRDPYCHMQIKKGGV
eukprot:COSAG01_NODE_18765_length_1054_cov_4.223037_1_plen_88_part_01